MTDLVRRIELYLDGRGEVVTNRFLSGEGVFLDDRLVAAVIGEDLCVRSGLEESEVADAEGVVRRFRFAGRPVPGWVTVDGESLLGDDELSVWIETVL
jgi:TfoX/Sxy family transcriptional regulator of competence genes